MRPSSSLLIGAALAFALAVSAIGCHQNPKPDTARASRRLVVLGFDGCDPQIVKQLLDQGKLPNFQRLANLGGSGSLATSFPAQSPVAWSTFITGMDAGGHGIFDFLHRDPNSLKIVASLSEVVDHQPRLLRQGQPFWKPLVDQNIPCTLLKVPANFPPPQDGSRMLTGLGTPDLLGSYGTYTYYQEVTANRGSASGQQAQVADWAGQAGGQLVAVEARQGVVEASFIGPSSTALPFKVGIDIEHQAAVMEVSSQPDRPIVLKMGRWSGWHSLDFGQNRGMVRMLLRSVQPFQLYVSPVNIDPAKPATPISSPLEFSRDLCRCCGPFYTQGMAEDTKALNNGALSDLEYLQQSRMVNQESWRLLRQGLTEFKNGLLFCYVSTIDLQSHVYWRQRSQPNSPYQNVVDDAYIEADKMIGEVLEQLAGRGDLLVLSDHGFADFNHSFDLNCWLAQKGYLKAGFGEPLERSDWSKTRAYGAGFNGLYLNRQGRESKGIVTSQEVEPLLRKISQELLNVCDEDGQPVISHVYRSQTLYHGPNSEKAPDLLVGYRKGYRVSWTSALGQRGQQLLKSNTSHWTGDHLMDPMQVPGVIFSSRRVAKDASLLDIAPSILDYFGVAPSQGMSGRTLWEK